MGFSLRAYGICSNEDLNDEIQHIFASFIKIEVSERITYRYEAEGLRNAQKIYENEIEEWRRTMFNDIEIEGS